MIQLVKRFMDFASVSDGGVDTSGEVLPWMVLFIIGVECIIADAYFFCWLVLVWRSIPRFIQLQIRNGIRGLCGRPPLPEEPLLPANARGGGGGAAAVPRA